MPFAEAMGPRARTIGTLYLLAAGLLAAAAHPPLTGDQILAKSAAAAAQRRAALHEYTGTRHYTVVNRRFGQEATGTVRMSHVEGVGTRLEVLATAGSERMGKIIRRIAGSEEEMSRSPEQARADLTPANYSAQLVGTQEMSGRSCYVLALTPKFHSKHLIEGKAWIDAARFALVRIEGQFAASVSAFLGRPHFTQEFVEVAGYWLPARARATSSTFLLGTSELEVDYLEYVVGSARYQASAAEADARQ